MAIQIKRTSDCAQVKVKMLVYGQAGAGKTSLIPTLPKPIILSAEAGLLSIKDANLPFIQVQSLADLREAYAWLLTKEADEFETVCLDSISEVAEVVLINEMEKSKDGRAAYGEMNNTVSEMIRAFRDLPKHVYMSAKLSKSADEMGKVMYAPSMPGKTLAMQLPYFFDEVFALRLERDSEGNVHHGLMCKSDGVWDAKDRSGKLSQWEECDLGEIVKKMVE